jgi:hypothetical protein
MTPKQAYYKAVKFYQKIAHANKNLRYLQWTMFLKEHPELSEIIAKDSYFSFLYGALINNRFKRGEKAISTSELYSYTYAKHVLNEKFNPKETKTNPVYKKILDNFFKMSGQREKY